MECIVIHNVPVLKKTATPESSEVVVSFLGCEGPERAYDKTFWKSIETFPLLKE